MIENGVALTLLVGAGAECCPPYSLPVGNEFTWETCYTKNEPLYSALEEFYAPLLKNLDKGYPKKYQHAFLYSPSSPEFKRLLSELISETKGEVLSAAERTTLETVFGDKCDLTPEFIDELRRCELSRDSYDRAFEKIVVNHFAKSAFIYDEQSTLKEAYFGTIESLFSSLLNPARRNASFWKLINYYWSAFFSVSKNLILKAIPELEKLEPHDYYSHVLNDLKNVVSEANKHGLYSEDELRGSYYKELSDLFEHAITTNYTNLSDALNVQGGVIHLSGSLWQFESVRSLRVCNISQVEDINDDLVFPYLLTQVPIKPVICWQQSSEIARVIEALRRTSDLCVLGYSFCKNDAHVASIVGSWLGLPGRRELHYFDYGGSCTSDDLCNLLRIDSECSDKLHIYSCEDVRSRVMEIRSHAKAS